MPARRKHGKLRQKAQDHDTFAPRATPKPTSGHVQLQDTLQPSVPELSVAILETCTVSIPQAQKHHEAPIQLQKVLMPRSITPLQPPVIRPSIPDLSTLVIVDKEKIPSSHSLDENKENFSEDDYDVDRLYRRHLEYVRLVQNQAKDHSRSNYTVKKLTIDCGVQTLRPITHDKWTQVTMTDSKSSSNDTQGDMAREQMRISGGCGGMLMQPTTVQRYYKAKNNIMELRKMTHEMAANALNELHCMFELQTNLEEARKKETVGSQPVPKPDTCQMLVASSSSDQQKHQSSEAKKKNVAEMDVEELGGSASVVMRKLAAKYLPDFKEKLSIYEKGKYSNPGDTANMSMFSTSEAICGSDEIAQPAVPSRSHPMSDISKIYGMNQIPDFQEPSAKELPRTDDTTMALNTEEREILAAHRSGHSILVLDDPKMIKEFIEKGLAPKVAKIYLKKN